MSDYRYHTYSIEILPHESRILIDGHVLRRTPDRLIPPGYPQSDFVTKAARAPVEVENILGERISIPHAPSPYPLPKREEINIDLSRLPAGTYFVRIETPSGVVLRRVVKQ